MTSTMHRPTAADLRQLLHTEPANGVAAVAILIRERARAVEKETPGWPGGGGEPSWMADTDELADHIQAMANPVVAMALADWMTDCAQRFHDGLVVAVSAHAQTLARAYLAADVEEGA